MTREQAERRTAALWFLMSQAMAGAMHVKLREFGLTMPFDTLAGAVDQARWAGAVAAAFGISAQDREDAFKGGVEFAHKMFEQQVAVHCDEQPQEIVVTLELPAKPDSSAN